MGEMDTRDQVQREVRYEVAEARPRANQFPEYRVREVETKNVARVYESEARATLVVAQLNYIAALIDLGNESAAKIQGYEWGIEPDRGNTQAKIEAHMDLVNRLSSEVVRVSDFNHKPKVNLKRLGSE